eukprot:SAG31_NODE_369_length_16731_cov_36.453283_6_plen_258_part_00
MGIWSERKDHVGDNGHLAVKPPMDGGTVESCKADCLAHSDCVAISFRYTNPQCKLHTDGVTTQDHGNWNYYTRSDSGQLAPGGFGGSVAALLLLMLCCYVVGGAMLGRRRSGADATVGLSGFLSSHPHYRHWAQLHGLVWDGLAFVTRKQAHAAESGVGGYRAAPRAPPGLAAGGKRAEGQACRTSGGGNKPEKEKKSRQRHESGKSGKTKLKASSRDRSAEAAAAGEAVSATRSDVGSRPKTTAAGSGGRWVHVNT